LISLCFPWISWWSSWRRTEGSLCSLVPKAQDSQALALDKLVLRCREGFIRARNLEKVAIPQGSDAGPASQHTSTSLPAWKLEHSLLSSNCDGLSQLISQDIQMLLLWCQSNPSILIDLLYRSWSACLQEDRELDCVSNDSSQVQAPQKHTDRCKGILWLHPQSNFCLSSELKWDSSTLVAKISSRQCYVYYKSRGRRKKSK
jgi:hypothetical protein